MVTKTLSILFFAIILIFGLVGTSCHSSSPIMQPDSIFTRFQDLSSLDGQEVYVKGTYVLYDPLKHLHSSNPVLRPGLMLEGDTIPQLFLEMPRSEAEMLDMNGEMVVCRGVFHARQPLGLDDPPHASRMSGSWLYNVAFVK